MSYQVIHPLDDEPEEKRSIEGRTPIPFWVYALMILQLGTVAAAIVKVAWRR